MRIASVLALALLCSGLAWAEDVNSDFGLVQTSARPQIANTGSPKALGWVDRTAIDPAASRPTAAAVGGKIYRIGGEASGSVRLGWTQEYDPIANTWTPRDSMPVAGSNLCCAVWNGKIYVPGGYTGTTYLANLQVFDPAAGTWTQETAMPEGRSGAACAVVGDTLYVIGGVNSSGAYTATCFAYDLVAQTWSTKNPMTNPRAYYGAAAVGGKIYAIGGRTATVDLAYNEEFDPAANTWTARADMPTARGGVGITAFGGKVYAVGGGWSTYLTTIDVYDPAGNTWSTETPMLYGCRTMGVTSISNDIYVVGGYNGTFLNNNQLGGQAPQIVWTSPVDGASGVHVASPAIKVAFSEPMDTMNWGYSWGPNPGAVIGHWSATRDTLTITHNQLAYSTANTVGVGGQDLSGLWTVAGPVPNPIHFTTWDAPEVIHDQLATTGNANVCQVFGDFSTYSTYLADDIDLAGMDSVVVSAIEIYGDYWTGHTGHPLDSLYLGFTTDSTDLPAWSQAVFQRNVPAGSFDDVPLTGTQNAYVMYLDPPAVLHNGKNWMVFAPIMNFSAKDGQWGWCQNNPPAVNHGSGPAARNPGGGFGSSTDWQRASTWPGMTGDAVFRALGRTYPTPHAFGTIDTTITFTTPASNTLAGITFCPADSNFYFVSMNDDSVYRLDPETWAMAAAFATDNPAGGIPWGLSWDGTHFWVSHIEGSLCLNKQYTFAGAYTGENYDVTGVGGSVWMGGMDFDGTYTWQTAVSGSNKLYRLDLANDTVVDSIPGIPWDTSQRGCSYIPWTDQFLSGGWNTGLIYLLDDQGNQLNTASLGSVADLDIYDFIAEGHELWALVSLNTTPNTIHKVWLGITRPLGVEGQPAAVASPRALLSLMPNYPNPVRGRTTISFSLPKAGDYAFRVYNIAGQLVHGERGRGAAGQNRLSWNPGRLAAGVYLYQVSSNGEQATRRLVVVK